MARKQTLNALSRTPEFRRLSVRQQLWLQTFIQSEIDLGAADQFLATKVAFEADGENSRTMSYQILRNRKVRAALGVWRKLGMSQQEILLSEVRADIAASKAGSPARAKLRAIELQLIGAKPKRRKVNAHGKKRHR
jgi:hypothetical protein